MPSTCEFSTSDFLADVSYAQQIMRISMLLPYAMGTVCFLVGWKLHHPSDVAHAATPGRTKSRTMGPLEMKGSGIIGEWAGRLDKVDDRDLEKFAAGLLKDSHGDDAALWMPLLARWSATDAPAMIAFIEAKTPPSLKPRLRQDAWFAWGASDPEAAFGAAGKLSPRLMEFLLKGVAAVDPRKAAELVLQVPESQFATSGIAERIVTEAPDLTEDFLSRAVYDGARMSFQKARTSQLAASDPAAAIAFARSCGVIGFDPVPEAVREIARLDPPAAVAQVELMPSSRSRSLCAVALAETWASQDPDAALRWTRESLSEPTLQYALLAVAAASGNKDPIMALDLVLEAGWTINGNFFSIRNAETVTPSETSRTPDPRSTAIGLLHQLSRIDPEAARRYLREKIPSHLRADIATATGITP